MFHLPDAKRVRRADLFASPRSSRSPSPSAESAVDPDLEAKLQAHFASLYGDAFKDLEYQKPQAHSNQESSAEKAKKISKTATFRSDDEGRTGVQIGEKDSKKKSKTNKTSPDPSDPPDKAQEPTEQSFEFRLFSTPSSNKQEHAPQTTQQIVLEPDVPEADLLGLTTNSHAEGGFLRDRKDPRVFTTEPATGDRLASYHAAAVTGEVVIQASKQRNWGLEVPWRVRVIQTSSSSATTKLVPKANIPGNNEHAEKKKRKPGKKRRIVLRMRLRKVAEEKERKEKEEKDKEEADKERKTRKNREKKMKQKMRAKAKAAIAAPGRDVEDGAGDGGMGTGQEGDGSGMDVD